MKSHQFLAISITLLTAGCVAVKPSCPLKTEAYITVSGTIDGSEQFVFKRKRITWTHKYWENPSDMAFSGTPWDNLKFTPKRWRNLPDVDLCQARIVKRSGRDVIALEHVPDGFILFLSDSPNGAAPYSITIAIPYKKKALIEQGAAANP